MGSDASAREKRVFLAKSARRLEGSARGPKKTRASSPSAFFVPFWLFATYQKRRLSLASLEESVASLPTVRRMAPLWTLTSMNH